MCSELTGPDPFDPPDNPTARMEVAVMEYRFSRHAVIHRPLCGCPRDHYNPARVWRRVRVCGLRDLLAKLWPNELLPDFATRDFAYRIRLALCGPALPVHPYHRTLMKESPMPQIPVVACPDRAAKFLVHRPGCLHQDAVEAAAKGTGLAHEVESLADLVRAMYAPETLEPTGSLEDIMDHDFEVQDCVSLPRGEGLEALVERALLRAYSALVALATTAEAVDAQRARDAADYLARRGTVPSHRRSPLLSRDVANHLAASSQMAAWVSVRQDAESEMPEGADDAEKARRWVAAAKGMAARFERDWKLGSDEGGTLMQAAFAKAAEVGRRRFLLHVEDALHEVSDLLSSASES